MARNGLKTINSYFPPIRLGSQDSGKSDGILKNYKRNIDEF